MLHRGGKLQCICRIRGVNKAEVCATGIPIDSTNCTSFGELVEAQNHVMCMNVNIVEVILELLKVLADVIQQDHLVVTVAMDALVASKHHSLSLVCEHR